MKTILIVDGYNAINALPETRKALKVSLSSARSKIIMITKEYARSSGYITDFCVVFDGQDRYRYLDRIDLSREGTKVFSDTGCGDEKIIEAIKKYSSRDRVVVASNDNYVRNNARAHGASLMNSEELVREKKKVKEEKPEKKKLISGKEKEKITEEYRKHLGLD